MTDILITPPMLRSTADQVRQRARAIQACIDKVDADIKAIGNRADNLRARYNRLRERIYQFRPLLEAYARELDQAAQRFEAADKSG
jgi:uncharacterized protein YukE